jgi:hypothetical protein
MFSVRFLLTVYMVIRAHKLAYSSYHLELITVGCLFENWVTVDGWAIPEEVYVNAE